MSEPNSSVPAVPPHDQSPLKRQTSDEYRTALFRAFLFQVALAVLASLMLDGGLFRRLFGGMSALFWLSALIVLWRRSGTWCVWYLRHGVLIVFGLCFLAGSLLPYDTLLDLEELLHWNTLRNLFRR